MPPAGMPWVSHQNMSPAVCCAVWGAVRSAGGRGSPAPPGPSPRPLAPWQIAQCVRKSAAPLATETAPYGTDERRNVVG
jgi:hypothetical protein